MRREIKYTSGEQNEKQHNPTTIARATTQHALEGKERGEGGEVKGGE